MNDNTTRLFYLFVFLSLATGNSEKKIYTRMGNLSQLEQIRLNI